MAHYHSLKTRQWAGQIPIKDIMDVLGESYKKSGKEWRWDRHDSLTFKGNKWFQHSTQKGGNSITLLTTFFDQTYDEAINYLLEEFKGKAFTVDDSEYLPNTKAFVAPQEADDFRMLYSYLIKERYISFIVIGAFVRAKLLYQGKAYGNLVFVGRDENNEVVFAHERSSWNKNGRTFKHTVLGSNWEYGFCWTAAGNKLHVFEAPIDMLAYITLHPQNWDEHSYIAMCGTSRIFLHAFLKRNPQIDTIIYGMDHDIAGQKAAKTMMKEVKTNYGNTYH